MLTSRADWLKVRVVGELRQIRIRGGVCRKARERNDSDCKKESGVNGRGVRDGIDTVVEG